MRRKIFNVALLLLVVVLLAGLGAPSMTVSPETAIVAAPPPPAIAQATSGASFSAKQLDDLFTSWSRVEPDLGVSPAFSTAGAKRAWRTAPTS